MGWLTYDMQIKCSNCQYDNKLQVKKGVTIQTFLKSPDCKCKNCGCKIEPFMEGNKKYWKYSTPYETEGI